MSEHTPAWKAVLVDDQFAPHWIVKTAGGETVAEMFYPDDVDKARLIAAAPALLAALEKCADWTHSEVCGHECIADCVNAYAAIAAAKGEK